VPDVSQGVGRTGMSDQRYPKREEKAEDVRESRASTNMVRSEDVLLRSKGYRIHSQPKRGEPTWSKNGAVFRQSEALKRCTAPEHESTN